MISRSLSSVWRRLSVATNMSAGIEWKNQFEKGLRQIWRFCPRLARAAGGRGERKGRGGSHSFASQPCADVARRTCLRTSRRQWKRLRVYRQQCNGDKTNNIQGASVVFCHGNRQCPWFLVRKRVARMLIFKLDENMRIIRICVGPRAESALYKYIMYLSLGRQETVYRFVPYRVIALSSVTLRLDPLKLQCLFPFRTLSSCFLFARFKRLLRSLYLSTEHSSI